MKIIGTKKLEAVKRSILQTQYGLDPVLAIDLKHGNEIEVDENVGNELLSAGYAYAVFKTDHSGFDEEINQEESED